MAGFNMFLLLKAQEIAVERLTQRLLASPTFHMGVRRLHRTIEDLKYGRDPNEPLRPGEATEEPRAPSSGFMKHFIDEIKNQAKGVSSEPLSPPRRGEIKMKKNAYGVWTASK